MDAPNLKSPEFYINRELSFLEFNQRVLEQCKDESLPVLERVRFLGISCSNLDEFFEIRVSSLKQRIELGSLDAGPDALSLPEQLSAIHERAVSLVAEQYSLLNGVLTPAMEQSGIRFANPDNWTPDQARWLEEHFDKEVEPVLTPLALDPARPFPRIQNKSLNFIVQVKGKDAYGRNTALAILQAPRSLPRIIRVPNEGGRRDFVYLSTIVEAFVAKLFVGMEVLGCYQFRVTRNSDLFVDEEEVDDLLRAVEGELAQRRYGEAVRLETAHDCPAALTQFLLDHFALTPNDLYQFDGPVNLNRLMAIYDMVDRPDLKYPAFTAGVPRRLQGVSDIFAVMRHKDVLLHHPYQSFAPVTDFVRQAAADPEVLAIKQTLYRTGADSQIVDALVEAAQGGKDVTVIIELRARFDEAANIELATRLQEAGAHVMYGVVGYKTHAKLIMVVRREDGHLRRYCHVGTGNYHLKTARAYTDYGLFTCDEAIGEDLHELFLQLTSLTQVPRLRKLLQSPFALHQALIDKIGRETEHARRGRKARIIAKMNALIEPQIIQALYEASGAGVSIDLVVRGICALRPGIPIVSDNIRVRSIVGRFLEHSRVYYFRNDGDEELYCASADWMERNFFRRVEVAFPVERRKHRERILRDLNIYLADNTQAWELRADGSYARAQRNGEEPLSAQQRLLQEHAAPGQLSA
ncbi:MAG TPA: polyphosphate kinase 1 [Steroidobacteraceae bacterium]|nr:polyphosphate kinase 1 [Steroidobacteraceae bacterium]